MNSEELGVVGLLLFGLALAVGVGLLSAVITDPGLLVVLVLGILFWLGVKGGAA